MVFETKQKRRNLNDHAPLVRVDALDRISQFPEHIIHLFLFFMPPKDAARTSALSKTWRRAWNSVHRSDFTFSYYCNRIVLEKRGAEFSKFVKSVDEALLPLREHKTIIQCFRLSMTVCDDKYAPCIDNWMELANRNHMETLYLDLTRMGRVKSYVLPKTTFSVGSLAELTLKGCILLVDYFGDNMNKFICLRKLTLESVEVDDLTVKKILCCCPLLEEFTLSWCMKAEFVHIGYAPKLKTAMLYGIKRIKIEAPNLEQLYCSRLWRPAGELYLDSFDCNNVKTLYIRLFKFSKQLLQEFNSKFPLLESLTLDSNFYDD